MQLKKILAILIAALMLFAFGCKKEAEAPAEKPAEAPAPADGSFTVTDMAGREVKFEKPVDKAVALTASDCEIIYAIGGEAALVGRGEYCDYPPEVMAIPSLTSGAETNIEQIIALEPDTVFLSMMAQTQEQVDQLEKAGIRVVVSDAQDIEGTFTAIRLIGQVLGKAEEADQIVADMNAIFDEIKANRFDGTKTIYFEVSPLQWGLWTAGTGTFMNEVAEMMGLKNCFDDVEGWTAVSEEQVRLHHDHHHVLRRGPHPRGGDHGPARLGERDRREERRHPEPAKQRAVPARAAAGSWRADALRLRGGE